MKRWALIFGFIAVVAAGWLLTRGRAKLLSPRAIEAVPPTSAELPGGTKAPPAAARLEQPAKAPSASSTPSAPITSWDKKARDYHDLLLNMKPERVAEIEAVAPRLHFMPDVTEKLSRWEEKAIDLVAATYSSVQTSAEWDAASKRAAAIAAAHHKAEILLLGGLAEWNRYYKLKGASMTGTLHLVDDNGDWPLRSAQKPINGGSDHFGPAPDTTEFDHYFSS